MRKGILETLLLAQILPRGYLCYFLNLLATPKHFSFALPSLASRCNTL